MPGPGPGLPAGQPEWGTGRYPEHPKVLTGRNSRAGRNQEPGARFRFRASQISVPGSCPMPGSSQWHLKLLLLPPPPPLLISSMGDSANAIAVCGRSPAWRITGRIRAASFEEQDRPHYQYNITMGVRCFNCFYFQGHRIALVH